jgi:hypothetical protein
MVAGKSLEHSVGEFTVTARFGLTDILVTSLVALQPLASVTVTL